MQTVLITGVTGVGKSTIALAVSQMCGLRVTDYADFILECWPGLTKDDIERASWQARREMYDEVREYVIRAYAHNPAPGLQLLENHLSVIADGCVTVFPVEGYWKYSLSGVIVLEASTDEIILRRASDPSRRRLRWTQGLIDAQQTANREVALEITRMYSVPLLVARNPDGCQPIPMVAQWLGSLSSTRSG